MLAGQPAVFLAKRLIEYKTSELNHIKDWSKMGTLVQGLSEKDIELIAAWYEAQKRY